MSKRANLLCEQKKVCESSAVTRFCCIKDGGEIRVEYVILSCLTDLFFFLRRRWMVDRKMSAENKIMGATTEISPAYIYLSPILKKCCKQNAVTFINSLCCAQKYLLKTSSFIVYYQHCSFRNIFRGRL